LLAHRDAAVGLLGGAIWRIAILGLFLWRGIVAIRGRETKAVTHLNFGVWAAILVATLVYTQVFVMG